MGEYSGTCYSHCYFRFLLGGEIVSEEGVTISFREIYEESKKTNEQLGRLSNRVGNIETRMDKQEERDIRREEQHQSFVGKVKVSLITIFAPVGLAIIYYVASKGGL